ncbi:hypothetical protein EAE32_00885 [Kocuria tytonicola]|uniref:Uncharacterized protein n=1 Tax=Kocuria tytonicola TaxID=2055946 RepID=A0A3L9L9S8_9MICC|nr:hypothetical protein [Kocuria tytonicola]RLY93837.1 hypothetical protein EAE32_00885 [Kocuria tytonicola]
MDENVVTHAELPPRGAAWLLMALVGAALGLLRTTVGTTRHDDGTAEAALSDFVIVGPVAVLLYFFLVLIKRPVHLGFFLASPARAGAATGLAVSAYAAPGYLLLDRSLVGAAVTLLIAAALGAAVYWVMASFFRRETPDSPEGL